MPSKASTSIVLTKKAQSIKDRWAPAFGLKYILSVGLELFDESLSDSDKIERVSKAKVENGKTLPKSHELRKALRKVASSIEKRKEIPAMTIKVSPTDTKLWEELRRISGLEPTADTKKA